MFVNGCSKPDSYPEGDPNNSRFDIPKTGPTVVLNRLNDVMVCAVVQRGFYSGADGFLIEHEVRSCIYTI